MPSKANIPKRLATKRKSSKKVVVNSPEESEKYRKVTDDNQNPIGAGGFGSFSNENGGYSLYQAKKGILVTEDLPADDLLKIYEKEVREAMLQGPMSYSNFLRHAVSRLVIEAEFETKNITNTLLNPKEVGLFYCAKNRTVGNRFRKTCNEMNWTDLLNYVMAILLNINQVNSTLTKQLRIGELRDVVNHDAISNLSDQITGIHQSLINEIVDLKSELRDVKAGVKELVKQNLVLTQVVTNFGSVMAKCLPPMFGCVDEGLVLQFLTTMTETEDGGTNLQGDLFRPKKLPTDYDLEAMASALVRAPDYGPELGEVANDSVQELQLFDLDSSQDQTKRRHDKLWQGYLKIKEEPANFDAVEYMQKLTLMESNQMGVFLGPNDPNVRPDPPKMRKNKKTLAKELAAERGEILEDSDNEGLGHTRRKQQPFALKKAKKSAKSKIPIPKTPATPKKKLVAKRRSSVKFVPDKEVMEQLKEKDLLFDSEDSDFE